MNAPLRQEVYNRSGAVERHTKTMLRELQNKTTFIVGSEKNAGKTTFLNYALNKLRAQDTRLAFLSTGVDGEREDAVFGNAKPRIPVKPGELVVTSQSALNASDAGFEILHLFESRTVLGKTALARIRREGCMEITGPQSNSQLAGIIAVLRGDFGAQTILVDGAASRFTQVASVDGAQFVYVLRVEKYRAASAAQSLELVHELSRIPAGKCAGAKNVLRIDGALTEQKAALVPKTAVMVTLEDCTKVFLTLAQWRQFAAKHEVRFERTFALIFAVANLYDISQEEFLALLPDFPRGKLVFNPYCEPQK